MIEKQKISEISILVQQLAALREQVNNSNFESKIYIEKRDKLNGQFKKLCQEIQELKNERNILNERVKILKRQRDETRTKIRTNIENINVHSQKITELKKKTSRENRWALQKEYEEIEWKIQTTPLDMQEEKRLIENVKQLETQLKIYKKIDQHNKKVSELRKELVTLNANADTAHQGLTETAKKSQGIHAKMIAKISESKKIKGKADSLHDVYLQAKKQVKPLLEEIKRLTEQKKKVQEAAREEDEKRKKNSDQALKEKLESQAKEKLQRGERLSWEEFKLLEDDEP